MQSNYAGKGGDVCSWELCSLEMIVIFSVVIL